MTGVTREPTTRVWPDGVTCEKLEAPPLGSAQLRRPLGVVTRQVLSQQCPVDAVLVLQGDRAPVEPVLVDDVLHQIQVQTNTSMLGNKLLDLQGGVFKMLTRWPKMTTWKGVGQSMPIRAR